MVESRTGDELARFNLRSFLPRAPGAVWTYSEMKIMRGLISPYEGNHPFCCLLKFLIDGYSPSDVEQLAELDLLNRRFASAHRRLNLLRLIDWEASFTEVELLSFTASLLEGDYHSAKVFLYGEIEGFDAIRYGKPESLFLELALSVNDANFNEKREALRREMEKYQVEYPYSLYDRWFEQPVLEKWLTQLPASDRSRSLHEAWQDLKARHGMADLYAYMHQRRSGT